jgi:hypothetical protein
VGQAFWGGLLAGGVSRTAVSLGILNSAEAETVLLVEDYPAILHRPLDPVGLNLWLTELQQGVPHEVVLASILGSQEYLTRP